MKLIVHIFGEKKYIHLIDESILKAQIISAHRASERKGVPFKVSLYSSMVRAPEFQSLGCRFNSQVNQKSISHGT